MEEIIHKLANIEGNKKVKRDPMQYQKNDGIIHECQYESVIDELNKNSNNMSNILISLCEKMDKSAKQLATIDKRLFIDNGTLSIQTQLRESNNKLIVLEKTVINLGKEIDQAKKTSNARVNEIEVGFNKKLSEDLASINDKIEEVKQMPKTFAAYTAGLVTLVGLICTGIIWLIKHV